MQKEDGESVMNDLEWYKQELKKLDKDYQTSILKLMDELRKKQSVCAHTYEHQEDLFYFCGETYPGMYCQKCGGKRHITDNER